MEVPEPNKKRSALALLFLCHFIPVSIYIGYKKYTTKTRCIYQYQKLYNFFHELVVVKLTQCYNEEGFATELKFNINI